MVYIKKILKKIWDILTWPYYRVKEEIAFRKRVKEMKKKDPFIYKQENIMITWGMVGNSHDASLAVFQTKVAGLTDQYKTKLLWASL